MTEDTRLAECPVCGAVGLTERIKDHNCPAFLERTDRTTPYAHRIRARPCVSASPEQVLDGYPLSIAETISCPGCERKLTEGHRLVVLAYRPHWSYVWAIETIRCRTCGSDSIRPTDRSGPSLLLDGRITTTCDETTQSMTLTFSTPSIHDRRFVELRTSEPSEIDPTSERRGREREDTEELRR